MAGDRGIQVEVRRVGGMQPTAPQASNEIRQLPPAQPPQEVQEVAEERTEQRRGLSPEDLAQTIAEQAQSGELLSKARPTPVKYLVTLPKGEHPDLAEDQAGDRVDMLASGQVREVDEQGNVLIDIDSASVIHGAGHPQEGSGHQGKRNVGSTGRISSLRRRFDNQRGTSGRRT